MAHKKPKISKQVLFTRIICAVMVVALLVTSLAVAGVFN